MEISETDHMLTLADGRQLGFAVYGDPNGMPVLNCHGGLMSRSDVALADADARDLGVCILSPDRPGIGLSSRWPGHNTAQWGDDACQLLDHAGVQRFGVMGWSLGGQYALAVAHAMPERVTGAAVIAGCLPLDDEATFDQLNRMDRLLARLSVKASPAARATYATTHRLAVHHPDRLVTRQAKGLAPADNDVLRQNPAWFAQSVAEATENTAGMVDEYRAMVAPWGFRPEDVAAPVRVWQGTADTLVPPTWANTLAGRVPAADLVEVSDGGHFISVTHRRDILSWLVEHHSHAVTRATVGS